MSLLRALIALGCLLAVGCAQRTNEPTEGAVATAGPPAVATTPPAVDDAATHDPPSVAPLAELTDDSTEKSIAELPVATEPDSGPPSVPAIEITSEASEVAASELAVAAPVAPTAREFEPAPGLIPSTVVSATSAETLDLSSLVTRLRKTKAINLRTKVAFKNESDDLLEQFRAYHAQHGIVTLADLRRSYDLLFHKLHSLLEDADPPLARDIDRSRAAIWERLADPSKFGASVTAGA